MIMILCIDVGNSQLFAGVFVNNKIKLNFRYDIQKATSSDQLGVFLRAVLHENNIDYHLIQEIGISSVVPNLDHSLASACIKYFNKRPFILQAGVRTGLKIKTKNPLEVGSDLIATAIAANHQFPHKDIIIINLGTATTFVAVNYKRELIGVVISIGIKTSMIALHHYTSQLPPVRILQPKNCLGRSSVTAIQSGLYYSQLGTMRQIIANLCQETFTQDQPVVVGTGGFANLFEKEAIFKTIIPNLILEGIYLSLKMNR